jgi:hypothetical protein
VAEAGGSTPEQPGERNADVEVVGRSGVAPKSVSSKCAAPEQGSSGRPVKKPWVRFEM